MKLSGARAILALLLLLALFPASLAAISVFDVVRLSQEKYADEDILRVIQATDSRFVLTAEDTIRLRKEGVTEIVIREMLARPAPEKASAPVAVVAASKPARPSTTIRGSGNDVRIDRLEPLFVGSPYQETGSDHRAHAAVTFAGIEVLILRAESGFPFPLARARAVAATLNGLAAHPAGRFAARDAGRDTAKVIFTGSEAPAADVVAVTPADVAAYQARSREPVSAGTLAAFWAALLNDYWSIGVLGRPPRYFVDSREGPAFERLSRAVRVPAGLRNAAAVRAALDSLGRTDYEHLRKLPTEVPEALDFPIRRSP